MKFPLFSINIVLVGTLAFLVWDTTNTWLLTTDLPVDETTAIAKQSKPEQESRQKKKRNNLRHYAMIGKKNLFRPEREEWVAPPPAPPPKPKAPPPPPEPEEPPPPPPLPDPTLDGIIILTENNKIALMKGSHREGGSSNPAPPAQPHSRFRGRSRRGSRPASNYGRIVTEDVKRYRIGDEVSEMTIENILDDRVVLKRKSGERVEIYLRTAEKTAKQVTNSIKETAHPTRSAGTNKTPPSRSSRFRRRSSRRPRRIPDRTQNNMNLLRTVE